MKYPLLAPNDQKSIDALKDSYGGAANISTTLEERRQLETRKKILDEKGFGEMIEDAERLVKEFSKIDDFENQASPTYRPEYGIAPAVHADVHPGRTRVARRPQGFGDVSTYGLELALQGGDVEAAQEDSR